MIIKPEIASQLLGYTDGENDALIRLVIPRVQDKIIEETNNYFLDPNMYLQGTLVIADNIIYGEFQDAGFRLGMDVRLKDSIYNDGVYEITEIDEGGIKVNAELEDEESYIKITRVKFPLGLELEVAQLIKYYLTKEGKLVQSESLPGGYSVTFKDEKELLKPFNVYRKPYK